MEPLLGDTALEGDCHTQCVYMDSIIFLTGCMNDQTIYRGCNKKYVRILYYPSYYSYANWKANRQNVVLGKGSRSLRSNMFKVEQN